MYLALFNNFFSFNSINLAEEGANYFSIFFTYINIPLICVVITSLLLIILGIKFMPKKDIKRDWKFILTLITFIILFYNGAILRLGKPISNLEWNAWENRRNIYNSFNVPRKSLQLSGFYEYIFRDIYLTYFNKDNVDNSSYIKYLDNYFSQNVMKISSNDFSHIFENKNLILVMMESIDNWLITKSTMPTVYEMMNDGINFTNHYTPIYGGGATFNSEFMVNTGLMTPFNKGSAAYLYSNNNFYYSLPNLFSRAGYEINAIHFNLDSFYNRQSMYKAFGYKQIYSSRKLGVPYNESVLDSHLITNEKTSKIIIPENNEKFMSFVITYTAHVPYTSNGDQCSQLLPKNLSEKENSDIGMTCAKLQAHETDNFFKLLLEKLENENKLNDTIVIAFADHLIMGYLTNKDCTN
jgi:phosphoglycerol transferase MdoB-like AlkP superfamily enzyme